MFFSKKSYDVYFLSGLHEGKLGVQPSAVKDPTGILGTILTFLRIKNATISVDRSLKNPRGKPIFYDYGYDT